MPHAHVILEHRSRQVMGRQMPQHKLGITLRPAQPLRAPDLLASLALIWRHEMQVVHQHREGRHHRVGQSGAVWQGTHRTRRLYGNGQATAPGRHVRHAHELRQQEPEWTSQLAATHDTQRQALRTTGGTGLVNTLLCASLPAEQESAGHATTIAASVATQKPRHPHHRSCIKEAATGRRHQPAEKARWSMEIKGNKEGTRTGQGSNSLSRLSL